LRTKEIEIDAWKGKFVDNIGDILVIYDREYRHVYANERTVKESGFSAEEMLGRTNRELGVPSDIDEVEARENKIKEVFETKSPTNYRTYHTFSKGNTQYYETRFFPELDEFDNVKFVYALTRNITSQVVYEEKFRRSLKKLKKKNKELDDANKYLDNFVHIIAHDFKNPLNNIFQLINYYENGNTEEEKNKYFNYIKSSFGRLENTILSLIDVVTANNSDHNLASPVSFEQVYIQVMEDLSMILEKYNGKIFTDFHVPSIQYIETYVISIFKNLVSNAIKYSSPHRPLALEITTQLVGKYILLIFKDNGIGIDLKRYQDKLFLPFKRFSNQAEGKGIGLSIIKTIIEKNGGRIEVESTPDSGTTFKVFLKAYDSW
jgi:PAS domain S-box-containing protein